MLKGMTTTSLRVSVTTRDALNRVAHDDFGGVSAEAALQRLLDEHVQLRSIQIMDQFRADDPTGYAAYLGDADADSDAEADISDGRAEAI